MRTILLGDIIAAARVLFLAPSDHKISLLGTMIEQADAAHDYQKRLGKPHPAWGNGSLMARANCEPQAPEPPASDSAYLQALHLVIGGIISHKRGPENTRPRRRSMPKAGG